MSEELNQNQVPDNSQNAETPKRNLAQERIDQLISKNKELADKLEKIEAAQRAESEKKLQEQNEWKTLYEQEKAAREALSPYKTQAEQLEADIKAENELRLARIPEEKKNLIPDGMSPAALSKYLTKNEALLFGEVQKPQAPRLDGGAGNTGGKGGVKLSDEEIILARSFGMSAEDYAAMKQKRGNPIELK